MSRDDGFTVMDLSTDYVNDPKWRRVYRDAPDHLSAAFMAYTATLCESWRAGRRVPIEEAWPVFLPMDVDAIAALVSAGLLDRKGTIPTKAWQGWFGPANRRREAARVAGREGNAKRWGGDRVAIGSGSGGDPRTVPSVPTDPSAPTRPSVLRAREERRLKEPTLRPERVNESDLPEHLRATR